MVFMTSTNGTSAKHDFEEIGPHVGDRAHQQAARARALNANQATFAVALGQQPSVTYR
jgi:hypothetical protein